MKKNFWKNNQIKDKLVTLFFLKKKKKNYLFFLFFFIFRIIAPSLESSAGKKMVKALL
jgi:hypothetical protein